MSVLFCTKRGCCCGLPVVIRNVNGRRVAIHMKDYVLRGRRRRNRAPRWA